MKIYTYDSSFQGLLALMYILFKSRLNDPTIVKNVNYVQDLISEKVYIETDMEKYNAMKKSITKNISYEALKNIYLVFLSSEENPEKVIFEYVKLGFKLKRELNYHLNIPIVSKVLKIRNRVFHESHILTGFIRFKTLPYGKQTIYYSHIEPDNDILELLTSHFNERMAGLNYIIHDLKRERALMSNNSEVIIIPLEKSILSNINENLNSNYYEILWKTYFEHMTIDDRINPKYQRRTLPLRYRKNMTEFN